MLQWRRHVLPVFLSLFVAFVIGSATDSCGSTSEGFGSSGSGGVGGGIPSSGGSNSSNNSNDDDVTYFSNALSHHSMAFAPPAGAAETTHPSGLKCITVTHPNGARATIALHGANILEWTKGGGSDENILFVSREAVFDGKKAIRGGIPLVFPHFGDGLPGGGSKLPAHGFARINTWKFIGGGVDDLSFDAAPFGGACCVVSCAWKKRGKAACCREAPAPHTPTHRHTPACLPCVGLATSSCSPPAANPAADRSCSCRCLRCGWWLLLFRDSLCVVRDNQ
jgi:hypothetical protein